MCDVEIGALTREFIKILCVWLRSMLLDFSYIIYGISYIPYMFMLFHLQTLKLDSFSYYMYCLSMPFTNITAFTKMDVGEGFSPKSSTSIEPVFFKLLKLTI